METVLNWIYDAVWGTPLLALITGVGFAYTFLLKGIQIRLLPKALRLAFGRQSNGGEYEAKAKGDISHFQALMTALAATMGIGNIAGVATAITSGGLGAVFWMWITALLGMATKYAEAMLAITYRKQDTDGEMSGGPMYFIRDGLKMKWLATSFAFFGIMASLGGGNMIQAHSVGHVAEAVFYVPPIVTAVLLAGITAFTLLGGIKAISRVASILVPFMAFFYAIGAIIVICVFSEALPLTISGIFKGAFSFQSAAGGFLGASVSHAVQVGVSRGLMTSEAGLGTASIAAAAAKTEKPVDQALVSMSGAFLATVIMCTMTALAIGVTQVLGTVTPSGEIVSGAQLTVLAFEKAMPYVGGLIVSIALILFAFTTLLGWAYYGEKCCEYIVGKQSVPVFRCIFILFVFVGGIMALETVWKISDIMNGLMAIPNLIGLVLLAPKVVQATREELAIEKSA